MYNSVEIDFFALVILPKRLVVFIRPEEVTGQSYRIPEKKVCQDLEEATLIETLGAWM